MKIGGMETVDVTNSDILISTAVSLVSRYHFNGFPGVLKV